jgi:hypothetical protein
LAIHTGAVNRSVPCGTTVALSRLLEIERAALAQADAPAGPVEQPRPQPFLELHHVLARHRGRDAQALRCGRKALQLRDQAEHPHADQRIHEIINT